MWIDSCQSAILVEFLDYRLHRVIDVIEVIPQKGIVGKAFKKDAKFVMEHLASLTEDQVVELEKALKEKR